MSSVEITKPRTTQEGDEKTNISGESDVTLIGAQQAVTYNDAIGFETAGKLVHRTFDPVPDDQILLSTLRPSEEINHSIETILSRPVKLTTVTFKNDSMGAQIGPSFDIIELLRTAPGFALAREKLTSFFGFRCRAHLRVTLNPQPFEAGLFQIYFIPFYNFSPIVPPGLAKDDLVNYLPFTTGCPNVFCNISLQSDVELSVPYTGPTPFINITNKDADFGVFFLQNIVPISDATSEPSCEMSVYMYFTEIELYGATVNTWAPQVTAQGPMTQVQKRQQPPEEESWLKTLRNFLTTSVSKGTNSLLDLIGLAKPPQEQAVSRMVLNPYSLQPTANGITGATKFSLDQHQQLKVSQLGVDSQDEMDIQYFVSKPTYLHHFVWTTSQDAGTRIAQFYVEPNGHLTNTIGAGDDARPSLAPTRLRFMANVFSFWRGTNVFRFIIVATKFHSGRLRFVYNLGGESKSYDQVPRAFSQIIDLRDGMIFEIRCPYFSSTPWRCVPQTWDDRNKKYIETGFEASALTDTPNMLEIYVENELRASSTVATELSIVVLQAGGEDFEFAAPRAPIRMPILNSVPVVKAQGEGDLDIKCINMCAEVDVPPTAIDPTPYTVGEKILNVREMLKRFAFLGNFTPTSQEQYVLAPYYNLITRSKKDHAYDWVTYFWPVYRFYRGGMRYQFLNYQKEYFPLLRFDPDVKALRQWVIFNEGVGPVNIGLFSIVWIDANSAPREKLPPVELPISATIQSNMLLQGGQEFEVPYYHRMSKCVTVLPESALDVYAMMMDERMPPGAVFISFNGDISTPVTVFRSVADDFNFGYLLGAPFTTIGSSTIPPES